MNTAPPRDLVTTPVESDSDASRLIGVLDEIWGGTPGACHLDHSLLTALAHAGEYAVLYEQHGRPIGGGVGFFGPPQDAVLHSHMVGVLPSAAGRGIGLAIKHHQRQWCLERGVREMTWTFDPLIGRNAAFNLRKLGARAEKYLENFYGSMSDGINSGQATDRILLRWSLTDPVPPSEEYGAVAPWVAEDASGGPMLLEPDPAANRRSVRVPRDDERLRRDDPITAKRWRSAVRQTLAPALSEGWSIVGFTRQGDYILERTSK